MRAILTIAKKDLRNLLFNPLFYIIAGLCSLIWSYSYLRNFLTFAERSKIYMQPGMDAGMSLQGQVFLMHISYANLLFVFLIPALTMRLLAEEKRMRTFDLLLTSPITATEIAIGKFLAGWGAAMVLVGLSFLYPLISRVVAEFPMAPLLCAYLGLSLVAGAYVAVGLFASSLTESIMLSVIMGLIFNLCLWFVSQGVSESGGVLSSIVEYMALGQHFSSFISGAIKTSSLVFMLSLVGLFVFLTQRVIESARWR
jgi:ABC-2 type transport system permease protein